MTTTSVFQNKPDFYYTKDECLKGAKDIEQTNPRYKNFKQALFTAGDEDQFQYYRDETNSDVCLTNISLDDNLFQDQNIITEWKKYKNLRADAVINTFRYIFHKFKKGIFVKIAGNKIKVFLPFSNAHFTNEWSHKIKIDNTKYGTMNDFMRHITEIQGYKFNPKNVNENIDEWYANNCLVRYEYPINEGDSNVGNVKNMLEELCATRIVPDIEFFINRRDFPLLTRNDVEPYNNIWGKDTPLVSHNYKQYAPILSMSCTKQYADIMIPTWEDWARIQSQEGKWFPKSCREYNEKFNIPWDKKKPTAVFRGGSTGCGVTINNNPRLKLAYLSHNQPKPLDNETNIPFLDAGIVNWNLRPRKQENDEYLQTIDIKKLPFGLSSRLSPQEQAGYKYIVNVDGHVTAFRLSLELSMGSVILLVNSEWKIWYSHLLIPYEHYVPIKEDLSDIFEQIKWCRDNDSKCEQIAKNAIEFFNKYLQKKSVLDFMQKLFVNMKNEMGVYLYNTQTPLHTMIDYEYKNLDFSFPKSNKTINDVNFIPKMKRTYGLLQGLEWVIRKIISEGDFERVANERRLIFQNKMGYIRDFELAKFSLAIKTTSDPQKIKEHIHEAYIATQEINKLSKYIPNFVYVFGLYSKDKTVNVITERIHGETLHEYINSQKFEIKEFMFIVMQICLAIQVAQNKCGLIHYDLTPWNIVLQRTTTPITFDYILEHDKIIRIRTSIIPVIIDYGKSHVIHNNIHHGFINMFNCSTIQDIVTLLVTSIDQITQKRIPQNDFSNLLHLANFLSGTKYRTNTFESAKDMRNFFGKARKYTNLIANNKYELEKYTPYDLIKYIMKKQAYKFDLGVVKEFRTNIDDGNARQVFEYILSSTQQERLDTYINVFVRLKYCTIPQPKNLFFIYFAAQSLQHNLLSVQDNMMDFITTHKIDSSQYKKIVTDTMNFINRVYTEKIDTINEEQVEYNIFDGFDKLKRATYTENTFLVPQNILKIITSNQDTDLSEYKEIIEIVLLNQGTYKIKDKNRTEYLKIFNKLLSTSSINMKNNTANINTLNLLSNKVYTQDKLILEVLLAHKSDNNCDNALVYLKTYQNILHKIQPTKIEPTQNELKIVDIIEPTKNELKKIDVIEPIQIDPFSNWLGNIGSYHYK